MELLARLALTGELNTLRWNNQIDNIIAKPETQTSSLIHKFLNHTLKKHTESQDMLRFYRALQESPRLALNHLSKAWWKPSESRWSC